MDVDVSELNSLAVDLARVPSRVQQRAPLVVRKVAADIERDAKLFAPVDTGFTNGNGKPDFVTPKAPDAAARPPTNEKDLCEAFLRVVLDNGPEADFVRRLADTEFDGDIAQAEREIHIRAATGGA